MTVSITRGTRSAPTRCDHFLEAHRVHIAFERILARRVEGFGRGQIERFGADEFAVRAGGIEMRVVGHDVALIAHHAEEDSLGGAALVRGNHVLESHDGLNRIAESDEAGRACVRFVAAHHGRPLLGGHRVGARIGEEVDQDVVGGDEEEVVAGRFEQFLALRRAWSGGWVRCS